MAKNIKKAVAQYSQDNVTKVYKKRVFIYIRVSTKHQAEEGYSIPEQKERLEKYAEAMGWHVVKVYIDGGYSGASTDRPAFQEMIEEIEKGSADIVLVDKIDRFARSLIDTVTVLEKCLEPNNVAFVSRAESFDTSTQMGKACMYIMAIFAEMERDKIKERMADGKMGRAKEGKYKGGGYDPIGYDYDAMEDSLEINEYEAEQIREIFALFNKRMPIATIARVMNDKGYRTKYGTWKDVTIRSILQNKIHIGMIKHLGEWYKGQQTAIIDDATFEKAQEILKERDIENANRKQGRLYRSPLGGLIICGNCKAKYQWRTTWKDKQGNKRSYYMCYSRVKCNPAMIKDANCKNKSYRDSELENIIFKEVRKLKTDSEYYSNIKKTVDNSHKINLINKRLEQIDNQLSRFMDLYSLGDMDMNKLKAKMSPLNSEKKSLDTEVKNLIAESKATREEEEVVSLVNMFDDELKKGNSQAVHDILSELIEVIEIDGEDIIIHWNF